MEKPPKYAVVVVHGISDKTGDQQKGFSHELAEKVMPDQKVRDKYWIEAVWEPVNDALDDKIQDVVLQLIDAYDKTTYWRDAELKSSNSKLSKFWIWVQWVGWKLLMSWLNQKTTRALDLVLDLPMYLGNPKGEKIRAEVKKAIRAAMATECEGVVLVGHSLGSVIAYDVIRESLFKDGEYSPVKAFVTMGSPLAWVTNLRLADKEVSAPPFHIGGITWINFYDMNDPVSLKTALPIDLFPEVQNEPEIRSGEKYIKAHTVYWRREEVVGKLLEILF